MNDITREWLEEFGRCKRAGDNLADSVFWRLAVDVLPEGVDGDNEDVKRAIEEIRLSIEKRGKR